MNLDKNISINVIYKNRWIDRYNRPKDNIGSISENLEFRMIL